MRTTITLDESLLIEVKQVAAQSRRTLTSVIEDALRQMLARRRPNAKEQPFEMVTYRGKGGLLPGVDLDDSAALLDQMEEDTWRDFARR